MARSELTHFQLIDLQFQLLDLACGLLAAGAEHHPSQLGNNELQMLDLTVTAEQLLLLRNDEGCECLSIE